MLLPAHKWTYSLQVDKTFRNVLTLAQVPSVRAKSSRATSLEVQSYCKINILSLLGQEARPQSWFSLSKKYPLSSKLVSLTQNFQQRNLAILLFVKGNLQIANDFLRGKINDWHYQKLSVQKIVTQNLGLQFDAVSQSVLLKVLIKVNRRVVGFLQM